MFYSHNTSGKETTGPARGAGRDVNRQPKGYIALIILEEDERIRALILEPDALALSTDLPEDKKQERYTMLKTAVEILNKPNISIYLDASHPKWKKVDEMVALLRKANIEKIRGFSINVSNFCTDEECRIYGEAINASLGGKAYVTDRSRNGNGSTGIWCNPSGRAIGLPPALGLPNCDAYLWVKGPGGSDGNCRNGVHDPSVPNAGIFVPEFALEMARNAHY